MRKKLAPVVALLSFLIASPTVAQHSTIDEIDPPGNREAYAECEREVRNGVVPLNYFDRRNCSEEFPHTRRTGVPANVNGALCWEQTEQRNPDVIRICEEQGRFEYDWTTGTVVRGSNLLDLREFTVINNSTFEITAIEVGTYNDNVYAPDLSMITLNPSLRQGETITILLQKTSCRHKFRVITSINTEGHAPAMDTCAGEPLVFFTVEPPPPPRQPTAAEIEAAEEYAERMRRECLRGIHHPGLCVGY